MKGRRAHYQIAKSAPAARLESTAAIAEANHVASTLVSKGYRLGPRIGKGSYAKVKVTERIKDGVIVAAKIISRQKAAKEFLRRFLPREISILLSVKHPSIVQIFEVIQTDDFVCLIIEYAEKGDLLSYVKKRSCLNEMEAKDIFYQIADAVGYLHGKSICHRDLKCENVLIRGDRSVALTDFGFSKLVSPENPLSNTYCGSAAYASPELLRGKPYNPFVADIWSLGCILFVTVTGQMPFYEKNTKKMMCRQLQGRVAYPEYCSVSNTCKDLISKTLEPNIDRRVDINSVLLHPWLGGQRCKFSSSPNNTADPPPFANSAGPKVGVVESFGFNHDGTDVDGVGLYLPQRAAGSQGTSNGKRYDFQAIVSTETEEFSSASSTTQSSSGHDASTIRQMVNNEYMGNSVNKQSINEVNLNTGSTRETTSMAQSSNTLQTGASKEKLCTTVSSQNSLEDSKIVHAPLDSLNTTKNMRKPETFFLAGPSHAGRQTRNLGANYKPLAPGPKRSIDPTFQRNIENILRVSFSKYPQMQLDIESKSPAGNQNGRNTIVATTDSDQFRARHTPSVLIQRRTGKILCHGTGKVSTVRKCRARSPDITAAIIPSSPTGHSPIAGNSQKQDIASERFHARQEGLVSQMRRIFESKDASTNTQITRSDRNT